MFHFKSFRKYNKLYRLLHNHITYHEQHFGKGASCISGNEILDMITWNVACFCSRVGRRDLLSFMIYHPTVFPLPSPVSPSVMGEGGRLIEGQLLSITGSIMLRLSEYEPRGS